MHIFIINYVLYLLLNDLFINDKTCHNKNADKGWKNAEMIKNGSNVRKW